VKQNIIYVTVTNEAEAKKISEELLNKKLIACVNIFPVKSMYWWKKKIEKTDEFVMIMKTKKKIVGKAMRRIKRMHSYEVSCIDVIEVEKSDKDYLKWIDEVTK
jgi:periplasmic divalent cation tolerance protein